MRDEGDPARRHVHLVDVAEIDLDELGHVNNVTYLRYAEEAARRHSAERGFDLEAYRAAGVVPVVRSHTIRYLRPAMPNDTLSVSTEVVALTGARALRHTEVRRARDGRLLAHADTEWVWLDTARGRPRAVPEAVLAAFGFA